MNGITATSIAMNGVHAKVNCRFLSLLSPAIRKNK